MITCILSHRGRSIVIVKSFGSYIVISESFGRHLLVFLPIIEFKSIYEKMGGRETVARTEWSEAINLSD